MPPAGAGGLFQDCGKGHNARQPHFVPKIDRRQLFVGEQVDVGPFLRLNAAERSISAADEEVS